MAQCMKCILFALMVVFITAACTGCNTGCGTSAPPAGMAVSAQTSATYSEVQTQPNGFWGGGSGSTMTLHGQHYGPNSTVTIKSTNVPGRSGVFTFGTATTDSNGSFTFSVTTGASTSDQSNWNTDVHVTAQQDNTGWFQIAEVNGGLFVNCLPSPLQGPAFSLTVGIPPWAPGQNYSCPQLPPKSTAGGGGGGGLGGCPSAGNPGCACEAGGVCKSGLVCEYGTTCIQCGGYGQPCCSGNSCSGSLSCQYSPAQNTNSCLP